AGRDPDAGAFAGGARGHGRHRADPVPVHLQAICRPARTAARARRARGGTFDARIHAGLRAAPADGPLDAAGHHRIVAPQRRHRRLSDGSSRRRVGISARRPERRQSLLLRNRAAYLRPVPRLRALPLGDHPTRECDLRYLGSGDARLLHRRRDLRIQARRCGHADSGHGATVDGSRRLLPWPASTIAHRHDADASVGSAERAGDGSPGRRGEAGMKGVTHHPVLKDVVLVGAGHSHVTVLRMFGMKPIPGVRLTLISREVHTPYSGMLPGLIAGHLGFDAGHIDPGPLARFAGARLYKDEVVGLDLAGPPVICRRRPPVPYDLLSLNIGSTPNTADVPGASEHAIPVKPIDGFLRRFEALQARVLARKGRTALALVGAGAGGVELLLAV